MLGGCTYYKKINILKLGGCSDYIKIYIIKMGVCWGDVQITKKFIFSAAKAAQETQMSVCLSVRLSVCDRTLFELINQPNKHQT